MTLNLSLPLAAPAPIAGAPAIGLTDALLLLVFAGLLVAIYQLNQVLQRLRALETARAGTSSAPAAPTSSAPVPVASRADDAPVPPEFVAAIAAACHLTLGRPLRIVSIVDEAEQKQVWSLEGRRQIFASHQVR
jgi:hypothetical protein